MKKYYKGDELVVDAVEPGTPENEIGEAVWDAVAGQHMVDYLRKVVEVAGVDPVQSLACILMSIDTLPIPAKWAQHILQFADVMEDILDANRKYKDDREQHVELKATEILDGKCDPVEE